MLHSSINFKNLKSLPFIISQLFKEISVLKKIIHLKKCNLFKKIQQMNLVSVWTILKSNGSLENL